MAAREPCPDRQDPYRENQRISALLSNRAHNSQCHIKIIISKYFNLMNRSRDQLLNILKPFFVVNDLDYPILGHIPPSKNYLSYHKD